MPGSALSGRELVCFRCLFLFQFIIVMINSCVCGGCTNSSLSGHHFLTRNRMVSSGPRCISAGEETGLH